MNNFKKEYQEVVNTIRVPDITADTVLNDVRHQKSQKRSLGRQIMAVATAACMLVVLGTGTVTAVNYTRSIITVNDFGFDTADEKTALLNSGEDSGVIYEETELTLKQIAEMENMVDGVIECDDRKKEYSSLEEFRVAEPNLKAALPSYNLLGKNIAEQYYSLISDDWLMVRVCADDKLFMIDQRDYKGTDGHVSSTVYSSGVCNKRNYTTTQGFTYQVVDSVREEGEPLRIHAAISVNEIELIVDFDNYTEKEAYQILDDMDLSVYF